MQRQSLAGCAASWAASLLLLAAIAALLLLLNLRTGGGAPRALQLLALVAWSCLTAADERALGPLPLHEPLVAAAVTGLILGDPQGGLWMGVVLQAIWPGLLPLGAAQQPLVGPAAVCGTACLIGMPVDIGPWRFSLATLLALTGAGWAIHLEALWRRRNQARHARIGALSAGLRARAWGALQCSGLSDAVRTGPLVLAVFLALPLAVLQALGRAGTGIPPLGEAAAEPTRSIVIAGALFALGGCLGRQWRPMLRARRRQRAPWPPRAKLSDSGQPVPEPPRLGWRRLLGLLTLQAGFSDRHLQGAGFHLLLVARPGEVKPAAKVRAELLEAMLETGNLNSHPVMAAGLVGAVERVISEARRAAPPRPPVKLLAVGGPVLAQWGDQVLWGGLRPALALLALVFLPLAPAAALAGFLGCGLLLHLAGRAMFFRWGWRAGWDIVPGIGRRGWVAAGNLIQAGLVPLALTAALTLGWAWAAPGEAPQAVILSRGLVWLAAGIPCGLGLGPRPLAWGWACGGAMILATGLHAGAGFWGD